MTKEEILGMKASGELDCLVAEHIMGWREIQLRDVIGYVCRGIHPITKEKNYIPRYSTDIKEALGVIESLCKKYFTLVHIPEGGTYSACFDGREVVICKTAPEAICKAALISVLGGNHD